MANRNFANGGKMYAGHVMPVLVDCNFVVDSTNGNGLGIRSLKGAYVQNVFMHTTSTPGAGNSNPASPGIIVTNPNPAAGTIVVQLQDNYNRALTGFNSIVSPLGSSVTATTSGTPSIVTSLGTSTAAQWLAVGMPAGLLTLSTGLPSVGTTFIPTSSATIGGSATVAPAAAAGSGIATIETVGDANQSSAPIPGSGFGAQLVFECRLAGTVTQPTDGTVISLAMLMSNSSILIAGE